MQVLIIKTSSLGDVVHTLPAITDAVAAIPGIRFDWVVEEGFAEIPSWHPAVDRVIPVALRRWRRKPTKALFGGERSTFRKALKEREYDLIIDAQGLLKSTWLAAKARGPRAGLSWSSAREPVASLFYGKRLKVAWDQHAVARLRALFAGALDYPMPRGPVNYGIDKNQFLKQPAGKRLLLLHGTTWPTKHYPEEYWLEIAQRAGEIDYDVWLPWGNEAERERAQRIADVVPTAEVLPKLSLAEMAERIAAVHAVISVDTGLSHLAAALDVPQVCIYGATDPGRTGAIGSWQMHLLSRMECSPCLKRSCRMSGRGVVEPPCFQDNMPNRVLGKVGEVLAARRAAQLQASANNGNQSQT